MGEATNTPPSLFGEFDYKGYFEGGEQRYKDDVVDMKFGFVMQHRPSPWEKDKRMMPKMSNDIQYKSATQGTML